MPGIERGPPPSRISLSRVASSHDPREQVLFANVDQLLIIGSVDQASRASRQTAPTASWPPAVYEEIPTLTWS